jgi:hypothetical protein
MSFRAFLRPLVLEMLEGGHQLIAADVVKEAQIRYPAEYGDEVDRLAFNAANREVKDFLKSLSEDDDSPQLALPGLDLPSVIAIPVEGGFAYKSTASCDWSELGAGLSTREINVASAQRKLDTYRENLDLLRPVMEGTPLTTAEAARKLMGGS